MKLKLRHLEVATLRLRYIRELPHFMLLIQEPLTTIHPLKFSSRGYYLAKTPTKRAQQLYFAAHLMWTEFKTVQTPLKISICLTANENV